MSERPFLDTNVLVYAYTLNERRSAEAARLLSAGGVVSVQVMHEFIDVARRKLRYDWDAVTRAVADLDLILGAPEPLTVGVHRDAIDVSRRYGLRIYDSLIVSSARHAGCRLLYTEDLQDGQTIDGVLIRNPFADI